MLLLTAGLGDGDRFLAADFGVALGVATSVFGVPLGVRLTALLGVPFLEAGESLGRDIGESLALAIRESLRLGVPGVLMTALAMNFLDTEIGVRHCRDLENEADGVAALGVENFSIAFPAGVFRIEGVPFTDD